MANQSEEEMKKRIDYINKYNSEHYTSVLIRLRTEEDRDVIQEIKSKPSMTAYIRELVCADMGHENERKIEEDLCVLMSTTNEIYGYSILEQGSVVSGYRRGKKLNDAVAVAIKHVKKEAERQNYNAVIGIHHSIVYDVNDGYYTVSVMGTLVRVEKVDD